MKTFKKIKEFCDTDLGGLVLSTVVMILVTIFAFLPIDARAVCASPIPRTNSSANSVLTSTKYNLDLNTLYTHVNNLPGDCIQDSTITFDKLDTSSFAALLNGIQQGCKVTYSNASTVLIDKCIASVNGEFIRTTTTTSASFGCANCSSETSSTLYYLYIKDGSTGTTITPLILTSAPNNDGYDASNNKVLARFYNNSSGDIDQYSIDQWVINDFVPQETGLVDGGAITIGGTTTAPTKATTVLKDKCYWQRQGGMAHITCQYYYASATGANAGSGDYLFSTPSGLTIDTSITGTYTTVEGSGNWNSSNAWGFSSRPEITGSAAVYGGAVTIYSSTQVRVCDHDGSAAGCWGSGWAGLAAGFNYYFTYTVPIEGWGD